MKIAVATLALSLITAPAYASCIGSGSYSTCRDNSGNRYTIQRYGDTTTMRGSNYNTGSTWSQRSTTYGNTTVHRGYDSNGNSWRTTCWNGRCR